MPYGGVGGRFGQRYANPNYSAGGGGQRMGNYWQTGGGGGPGATYTYRYDDPNRTPGLGELQSSGQFWTQVQDPTLPPGQTKWFNSQTGEYYTQSSGGGPTQMPANNRGTGPANTGQAFWWLNGLGNLGERMNPEWTAWEGSGYQAPDAWVAPDIGIPDAGVDVRAIVNARRHYLDEEMGGQMADAARQLGAAGMLMSSDYVDRLGEAERKRDRDLADLWYSYDYNAAEADAQRRAAARENALNRSLEAWGTRGGWQNAGQMAGADRDFQAWLQENLFNERSANDSFSRLRDLLPLLAQAGGGGASRVISSWI